MDRDRQQRLALNEVLRREINEAIERGQWPGEQDRSVAFRCECANLACNALLELTPREYEHVRAHPGRFVVLAGHERADVETVVEHRSRYVVVDKRDEAGSLAEATDPRD